MFDFLRSGGFDGDISSEVAGKPPRRKTAVMPGTCRECSVSHLGVRVEMRKLAHSVSQGRFPTGNRRRYRPRDWDTSGTSRVYRRAVQQAEARGPTQGSASCRSARNGQRKARQEKNPTPREANGAARRERRFSLPALALPHYPQYPGISQTKTASWTTAQMC